MTRLNIDPEIYASANIQYLNLFKLYQYVFKVNTLLLNSRKNTLKEFKEILQNLHSGMNQTVIDMLISTIHTSCIRISEFPFQVDSEHSFYFPYKELIQNIEFQNSIKDFVIQACTSFNLNPSFNVFQLIETIHSIGVNLLSLNKDELVETINQLIEPDQKITTPLSFAEPGTNLPESERLKLIQLFMEYYYNKLKNILSLIVYKLIEKIFILVKGDIIFKSEDFKGERAHVLTLVESFIFGQLDNDPQFKLISYFRDITTEFFKEKMQVDYNVDMDISDSIHKEAVEFMDSLSTLFKESFSIPFTNRHLQSLMDENIYHIFYIRLGAVVKGCLFVKEDITVTPSILTIQNVATLTEFRNYGIATNLIKTLLNVNQVDFKLDILLPSKEQNNWIKLLRFYLRFGFVPENISFENNNYVLNLISVNKPSRSLIMEERVNQMQFQVYFRDLKTFLLEGMNVDQKSYSLNFINRLQSDYIYLLVENLYSNINKFSTFKEGSLIQLLKRLSPSLGIMTLPNPVLQDVNIYNFNGTLYKFYISLSSKFFIPYYDELDTRHLFLLFDNFFTNDSMQNIIDTLHLAIRSNTSFYIIYISPYINDHKFNIAMNALSKVFIDVSNIEFGVPGSRYSTFLKIKIRVGTGHPIPIQLILDKKKEIMRSFLVSHICSFRVVISPDEFLSIRNNLSSMGTWDLVQDGHTTVLKNRKDYRDFGTQTPNVKSAMDKISYVILRSQIHNYDIVKKTIHDFLRSSLKNGIAINYAHTILPIMITREGVYIIYINPQFYVYVRLLFEECRHALLGVIQSSEDTSNGIDRIEWLDIRIKNKIKDIYDMYGLHQMTHSRAENVIFDNVNITNSILSGFKNYIDSLTVMSLVKQDSQEHLVLKNFCSLMDVENMPLFYSEVFSWETIVEHDIKGEYIEFDLNTISKECPPFDMKEKKYKRKTEVVEVHQKSFSQDKLDSIMHTVKEIEQPLLTSKKKRKFDLHPDEDVEELADTVSRLKVKRVEEALEEKEEVDILSELQIVNELLNETMKHDPSVSEIEEQSMVFERKIYEELLQREIEEYLESQFKSQLDGTLEANSYQLDMLRQISVEEIIENITYSDISLEQLREFADNVKKIFIYRMEIFSIMKSILRDITYKGYSLLLSIKQVSEMADQVILDKINDVDYNYITREELIELVRKAKVEYIGYLKFEIEKMHMQLDRNTIMGVFSKLFEAGVDLSHPIDYYLQYFDYDPKKIHPNDKNILSKYMKEYLGEPEQKPEPEQKVELNWEEEYRNEQEALKRQIVDILHQYPREMFEEMRSPDGSSIDDDLIKDIQSMIDPQFTVGMSNLDIADTIMNVIDVFETF